MFIRDLKKCEKIIAGDNTILRELLNPLKKDISVRYSLAHRLKSSEVYYILQGKGEMYINNERENVSAGQLVYIPPDGVQRIKNTGRMDLTFLCIVDPAWKPEDEEVCE